MEQGQKQNGKRYHDVRSAGSRCRGSPRAGETPESANPRAFAGLRRVLLFENQLKKHASPGLGFFFETPTRQRIWLLVYFRFFREPQMDLDVSSLHSAQ